MQENKTTPAQEQVWDGKFPPAQPVRSVLKAQGLSGAFSGGSGTEVDPYLISTPWDLAQIPSDVAGNNEHLGEYFKLTNDIYLNYGVINPALVDPDVHGAAGYDGGQTLVYEWKPIGGAGAGPDEEGHSYCFKGHFDGDNHTIHNAFYNQSIASDKGSLPENEVGIFGDITNEATIKNLKTKGGYIGANISVGGIVGRTWGGDIINCHNENFVYGVGSQGAGGIAGTSWVFIDTEPTGTSLPFEMTVIDKCSNKATVVSNYVKTTDKHGNPLPEDQWLPSGSAGGIVGENEGGVINSWNTGIVSGRLNVGGIVGSNQNSSGGEPPIQVDPSYINNCYNTGDIGHSAATGLNNSIPIVSAIVAGGIMGYQTGTCENVYNIGNVTDAGVDTKVPVRNAAGQIIGEMNTDANQTNDWLNTFEDVLDPDEEVLPPVGVVAQGSCGLGTHLYTFDDSEKVTLLNRLNNWVGQHPSDGYESWVRNVNVNDGFPYLSV
jgi:hypothetical protein